MRPYETMVIFDPTTEEPAIAAVLERAQEIVRSHGGNPGAVERWGKRSFAYELRHKREGYYVLFEMTAAPAVTTELDRMLGLADEVMRHKIIRLPDKTSGRHRIEPSTRQASAPAPARATVSSAPVTAPAAEAVDAEPAATEAITAEARETEATTAEAPTDAETSAP